MLTIDISTIGYSKYIYRPISRHAKRLLTSNRDAEVPFGTDVAQKHRNKIIQRHNLYLEIQDGGGPPSLKTLRITV